MNEQENGFQQKQCSNPDKCEICDDELNCNNQAIVMERCVDCNSSEDNNCIDDPLKYMNKICSTISSTDRENCYLKVVSFEL